MSVSEWLIVHIGLPVGLRLIIMRGQSIHKFFQSSAILCGQFSFERMRQSSLHSAYPAIALVVQISTPSRQFTTRIHPHPINRANDPHHLSFGQNFAATHTGSLGHMLYTLDRFLGHLQFTRRDNLFPIIVRSSIAALVYFASHNRAESFIELQLNGLLLALLALLLIAGFLFNWTSVLEDFRLHLK